MDPSPQARPRPARGWIVPALAAALALLHLATLSAGPGASFGDDYAQYVAHARNLAEGRPYGDTGYVFNPLNPWYAPRSYPPGFPLLLAPVYAALGMDFRAMKAVVVLFLAGTLLLLARVARREGLREPLAWAAVALLGLHPFVWLFRDNVLPDIPFTFFCLLSLHLADRSGDPGTPRRRWALGAGAVLAAGCALATRTAGIVLVPTLAAVFLLRTRRPARNLAAAAGALALVLALRLLLFPSGSGYLRQLRDLVAVYGPSLLLPDAERAGNAGYALAVLWSNGASPAVARVVAVGTALLAATGLVPRLRRASPAALFVAGYLCMVLLWPAVQPRYLLPVLPLYLVFALLGAERLARAGGRAGRAAVAVAALAVLATYAARHAIPDPGRGEAAMHGPHARELHRWIGAHTRPDDRFVATRARALALYTRRAAAPPARKGDAAASLAWLRDAGIDYLVARTTGPDLPRGLVERHPERFRRVYAGPAFQVFRTVFPDAHRR